VYRRIVVLGLAIILCTALSSVAAPVRTGAEVLSDDDFSLLRDLRFGLVTNSTAVVAGSHILDLMKAAGTNPAVIFTPEHGLNATSEDGVHLADSSYNGIPVISLYGKKKQPQQEELEGLDLLVFDIQDIGVRFYTYISTMGLAMQAAADAEIPFMVLDRPNPLGGEYVSGFVRKEQPGSFTSMYPIPVAHGMTVGELAGMIKGESWLSGLSGLDLIVVTMEGWQRWMRWPDTELTWLATSPNIPDFNAALLYPGIGLLEGTGANEGRGTPEPFRLVGCPDIDGEAVAARLNHLHLAGVMFEPVHYTPVSIPGKSSAPKCQNKEVSGVRIITTDYRSVQPVETGVAVAAELYEAFPGQVKNGFFRIGFDDMAGSPLLRKAIEARASGDEIGRLCDSDLNRFRSQREKYLLYGTGSESVAHQ
jgi:uncharacterized protein YbbC (DUF1343 family)